MEHKQQMKIQVQISWVGQSTNVSDTFMQDIFAGVMGMSWISSAALTHNYQLAALTRWPAWLASKRSSIVKVMQYFPERNTFLVQLQQCALCSYNSSHNKKNNLTCTNYWRRTTICTRFKTSLDDRFLCTTWEDITRWSHLKEIIWTFYFQC